MIQTLKKYNIIKSYDAYLVRMLETDKATLGYLYMGGMKFFTLENPWVNNEQRISRISDGVYEMEYIGLTKSEKFQNAWFVRNVPDRSEILFHRGNFVHDTHGCILVGTSRSYNEYGEPQVNNSRRAMQRMSQFQKNKWTLNVIDTHLVRNTNIVDSYFLDEIGKKVA